MNKNLLFVSILVSFLLINIESKKCCQNQSPNTEIIKDETKGKTKAALQYYMPNKIINFSHENLQLKMEFDGINQFESEYPKLDYRVTYIASFYDRESLGIDNIQSPLIGVEPLYREYLVKFGNDTKGKISWEIEMEKNDEKIQVAQIIAQASYLGNTEEFCYNSFYFKFKNDKTTEFWVIFCGFIGIICLTFCAMFIFFLFAGKNERKSLQYNDINAIQNESERESRQDNSKTTD